MTSYEEYKKERMLKFKQNDYINKFIENNNFNNAYIYDHFSIFDACLTSLEMCENCPGLEKCNQRTKGEKIVLVNDGLLDFALEKCNEFNKRNAIENIINSYVYSNIPQIYADVNLANIKLNYDELKPLFIMCYDIFEEKRNKGLYIYGDMGVGKTYMCYALANSLVKKKKKVSFIKINDFVTYMANVLTNDSSEYRNIIENISKCDYVFFDDIGSESVSEFSRDRLLFNILDYRMENKLCTIFTSNLDKESLLKHFAHNADNGINSKRIMERIKILTDDYYLLGKDKRGE